MRSHFTPIQLVSYEIFGQENVIVDEQKLANSRPG
jgi:hypothetical protein